MFATCCGEHSYSPRLVEVLATSPSLADPGRRAGAAAEGSAGVGIARMFGRCGGVARLARGTFRQISCEKSRARSETAWPEGSTRIPSPGKPQLNVESISMDSVSDSLSTLRGLLCSEAGTDDRSARTPMVRVRSVTA